MALMKLKDFYPDYSNDANAQEDVENFDVYDQTGDKVGSISDILVDDASGRFRYLVVDTGFWIFGKKVLLPIGLAHINYSDRRIDVPGLEKEQIQDMPNFSDLDKIDYDYEEEVRGSYRPVAAGTTGTMTDTVDTSTTTANPAAAASAATYAQSFDTDASYDRSNYSYDRDPALYNMDERRHNTLRLYEERLIANKSRQKTGEVAVGKRVETETAHVQVPIEKERVVIERTPATGAVTPGDDAFNEGQVARVEVYEETPDIRKETVLREEVRVRKEVDQNVVNANETLRREEIDIDSEGNPIIDRNR